MYMDFDKDHLATHGCGRYERIPSAALSKFCPLLFLAYQHDPSDSGKIHSDVKQRWLNGEKEVVDAMAEFGRLSDQARTAILDGDKQQLATLMDANFNLRR
jgi:glucuronokinase